MKSPVPLPSGFGKAGTLIKRSSRNPNILMSNLAAGLQTKYISPGPALWNWRRNKRSVFHRGPRLK